MLYRPLGDTGKNISVVGFGVWTVSTTMWGINDDEFSKSLLRKAYSKGINFFDTADVYGDGKGETILHDSLGSERENIVIATKFGYDFVNYPGPQPGQRERPHDWTAPYIKKACEASLKRLNTDYIDLYQLHNPRLDALQNDEVFAALEELKSEGKILGYGAALGPALKADRQIEEGLYCVVHRHTAVQIIYNLLEQVLGESICPLAESRGVPVLVRVPHASGILEGSYTTETEFAPTDHRSHRVTTDEMRQKWLIDGIQKVEKLQFAAQDAGRTLGQMAIQFILTQQSIASLLPNIYDADQLDEFAAATDTPAFTPSELNRVIDLYEHNFYLEREPVSA